MCPPVPPQSKTTGRFGFLDAGVVDLDFGVSERFMREFYPKAEDSKK